MVKVASTGRVSATATTRARFTEARRKLPTKPSKRTFDMAANIPYVARMQPGDRAPDFELPATGPTDGGKVRLADFRGKKTVVLYFYPKDQTPGCIAEACSFRDDYEDFSAAGAEVIGVSD